MTQLWDYFIDLAQAQEETLAHHMTETPNNMPSYDFWSNKTYDSENAWAHQSIIDKRKDRKIWMMHTCIFPKDHMPSPIYGFDVIVGPNKITGCFHDYSPTFKCQKLTDLFYRVTRPHHESKRRELPEWAKNIFSPYMLASGNVKSDNEAKELADIGTITINLWFTDAPNPLPQPSQRIKDAKSYYCHNQLQNPHSPKVMETVLGIPKEDVSTFKTMQFPY